MYYILLHTQVKADEAWLKDEIAGSAYLPQQDGTFDLRDLAPYTTLTVEGPSAVPVSIAQSGPNVFHSTSAPSQTVSSTPMGSSLLGLPATSTVTPPSFRSVLASRRLPSFSLKILKAMIRRGRGKADFAPSSQTYIELVDTTANLEHIMGVIRNRWGSEYVLVTNDGLELEDSPATQGFYYHI